MTDRITRGPDVTEWQPIDTAPKDGTQIDIWVDWGDGSAKRIPNANWNDSYWHWLDTESDLGGHACWTAVIEPRLATHWMPLPCPPSTCR